MFHQYSRGSEWRRWELHLHTPQTKKNDQFEGKNPEEKWDKFYQTIQDYIGDGSDPSRSICAIAITDYLSIDNYLKVRDDKRLPDCVKLLLPNVEFRMLPLAKDGPINIHCIFSPDIVEELEARFFSQLSFSYKDTSFKATRRELERLGREHRNDKALPDEEALKIGTNQFMVSRDALREIFEKNPDIRSKTIVVASGASGDGLSGVLYHKDYSGGNCPQLDATRQGLYQMADMIFSATPSDRKYLLGKGNDDEDKVKRQYGSLKPCIHGSDAHTNDKVFKPHDNRFCWIKADPTFEGLKQLLYEPADRVHIGDSVPLQKNDYQVIDRVEIVSNSDFDKKPILFNDNLTCIIGGKSTGKSLLLHNMANAIDEKQVADKDETAKTNVMLLDNLVVHWRDGKSSADCEEQRGVVYIPQSYLNKLSDVREETTEIDKLIQETLLQDKDLKKVHEQMLGEIKALKQETAELILDFLATVDEKEEILKEKKEIGDKAGINAQIEKDNEQLKGLSKEFELTEQDIQDYQGAYENVERLTVTIRELDEEANTINSIMSVVIKAEQRKGNIRHFHDELEDAIKKAIEKADEYWLSEKDNIIKKIKLKRSEVEESLKKHSETVKRLAPKIKMSEQLSELTKKIGLENEKLHQLSIKEDSLRKINEKYEQQLDVLSNTFENFASYYETFIQEVELRASRPSEDLNFKVECVFRSDSFREKFYQIFDNRSLRKLKESDLDWITRGTTPECVVLRNLIKDIVTNSSSKIQLKSSHNAEDALREILTDWYNIDYVVEMDGDSIKVMSPGKKALVLLRLLISMAESKWPILIDQPEDDLDNRSIFDELITFIKAKKVNRQIIVATHNANVVLGGDAELIIIANQDSENAPNKQYRFEYRGGSIENNQCVYDKTGQPLEGILNQSGIQAQICEILEGGQKAFDLRRNKYRFSND